MKKTAYKKIMIGSAIFGLMIILIAVSIHNRQTISQTSAGGSAQTLDALGYIPLSGPEIFAGEEASGLSNFMQNMFFWGIAIAIILAVLMVVLGAVQYMTSDAVFNKEEGKNRIVAAIGGLILALVSWLILYEINPQILNHENGVTKKNEVFVVGRKGTDPQQSLVPSKPANVPDAGGIHNTNLPARGISRNVNMSDDTNTGGGTFDSESLDSATVGSDNSEYFNVIEGYSSPRPSNESNTDFSKVKFTY